MESDHVQPDLEEGLLFQEFVDGVFATNEVPFRVNDGASYEYVPDTPSAYQVTNYLGYNGGPAVEQPMPQTAIPQMPMPIMQHNPGNSQVYGGPTTPQYYQPVQPTYSAVTQVIYNSLLNCVSSFIP